MFHVIKGSNLLDEITDPAVLTDRVPSFAKFFDSVEVLRDTLTEARQVIAGRQRVGMTNDQTMMRVACIPLNVRAAILAVEPNFYKDKRIFYRWLNRHRDSYGVGYSKSM